VRALQLISEYSKPITRGDWRTFPRITMKLCIKNSDYLFTNKRRLFDIIHGARYHELYNMPKGDLFWLINDQFEFIKYHTIIPLATMTKRQMVYVASYNNELMKLPNCGQKKFFKDNQDLMKGYEKNNKLKNGKTYKENRSRRITMY
jgi:hypothetical protein